MKQIVFNINETQLEIIDKIAKELNRPRNDIMREAISIYISMYLKSRKEQTKNNEMVKTMD